MANTAVWDGVFLFYSLVSIIICMNTVEYLQSLRHSCAHLLAKAVLTLYPGAHNAIGPSIENGFYQDFDLGDVKLSDADLPAIEAKMREILPTWTGFTFNEVTIEEARELFRHNPYKVELAEEFAGQGKKLTTNNPGDFLDLCKMGHVENPSKELQHFKLQSVAGAYWRGDEKNTMLTRIYGTCWPTQEELERYLTMLEEAKKRDHRKLGKQLDLFTFSELVGPGLALWTPKGTLLRTVLDDYVWELRRARGYHKVEIPHITKKDLYETSGHWQKFAEELFRITTREGHQFAMKPMNCPHHTQIFARQPHSYREMPQRYANTTMVYRDEQTGELSGLSRVRCITQDDAHVFCRPSQVKEEFLKIWDIIDTFYAAVGFDALAVELSLHDPQAPEKYLGTPEQWQQAEDQLRALAAERGVSFVERPGEAAFYGPKVDFIAKDSLGRTWQVATIQLDMNMPERFDLSCINEQGSKERVVMIHAAIMGSIERFLSILIEHHAGVFPTWLSPVQVQLIPVSDAFVSHCQGIQQQLSAAGIRVEVDQSNETVGKKIRAAEQQRVPYMLVIGEREAASGDVAVRRRGSPDTVTEPLATFIDHIRDEVTHRGA